MLARYFHLIHSPPSTRDQEFDGLIRVLEAYHRRTTDTPIPDAGYTERLEAILSSVPEEHRQFVEEELAYSHEPSLQQRLKEILAMCSAITKRVVGNSRQRGSFARKVVVMRNYETHLDSALESEVVRGTDLLALVFQLRALVEMVLLLEIGFTCDDIDTIFGGLTRRYAQIEHFRS